MRSREVTITRELATSARGVRVMTVHGAKGLEAPIVILADAVTKPRGRQLAKGVIVDPDRGVLFQSNKKTDVPGTAEVRAEEEAASRREYWRKLYVGMTRAEDELYVTGAYTPGERPDQQKKDSWYEAIESSLGADSAVVREPDGTESAVVFPAIRPAPNPVGAVAAEGLAALAGVSLAPLAPHVVTPIIRPSSAFEPRPDEIRSLATAAESIVDAETARKEGIALHALLQHLAHVEATERPAVAARALRTLLPEAGERHARLAAKAVSIISRPELAVLFGPDGRAEVPFLANAARDGKPVRLAGRIDRLVVRPDHVLVVDFKSDANPARDPHLVPAAYVAQLGLYALVATQLFPAHEVRAAILWTSLESLLELPREALAGAASAFTMR
jgi:ATP-dependent helicase/nuclease subunit A